MRIIVSEAEYRANLVPWLMVAEHRARVVKLRWVQTSRLTWRVARADYAAQPYSGAGADVQRHRRLPDLARAIEIAHAAAW
ncbi:MAG: hypothetical protein ACLR9P_02170 [Escherichia coli]